MTEVNWNQRYIDADTPWDSGQPSLPLKTFLQEKALKPCRVLELGCGTGTNAIYLAQRGFDVTGVDIAEEAIKRAQMKAKELAVKVNFIQADATSLPDLGDPFPFVFDRGTYHVLRSMNLTGFQSMLAEMVAPGGFYLVLAGNPNEDAHPDKGPPRVSASDLCAELEGLAFDLLQLEESYFHGVRIEGEELEPLAWKAILRRRQNERAKT